MISNQIGQSSVTLPHSSPPFSRLASVQVSRRCIHYFTKEHETRHPGSFFVGPSRRAGHGRKDAPYLYKRDLYYLLTCFLYFMFFGLWLHVLMITHAQCQFVYSYFEKGCRKKCTRQSRKVLWGVLSSLFFNDIWKNDERGHGRVFASAKGKQQK